MSKEKMFLFLPIILSFVFSLALSPGLAAKSEASSLFSETTWHFIAISDTQQPIGEWDNTTGHYTHENSSNPIRRALMNSIVENNPNLKFIVHAGDMVTSGGEQDDWDRYFEDIANATSRNIPIYYAVGNHEFYKCNVGEFQFGAHEEDWATYLANVQLPGNERFYSFDYNDQIHFTFINTDEDWHGGFQITAEQQAWLVNDLANKNLDFTIAVFHRPCYSIRSPESVQQAHRVREILEPMFVQYKVDLAFSGHNHYYYRTARNGIMHVVTGGGGANLGSNNDLSEWQEGDVFFSAYHYCNVTIQETYDQLMVRVDALIFHEDNKSTTLADSFQISKTLGRGTTSSQLTTTHRTVVYYIPIFSALGLAIIFQDKRKRIILCLLVPLALLGEKEKGNLLEVLLIIREHFTFRLVLIS
ncbi:MAG: metallophosphoesterase family protein [Candidatus Thorarchaeota archaeon]